MKAVREFALESLDRVFRASRWLCLLILTFSPALALAAELPGKTFELTIPRSTAQAKPSVLRVEKDDMVRLRVASETAGEVHLHGYRLEMKLAPGIPGELNFRARATGRYRIEWHPADEAAKKGNRHGPPLAILEVHPK